MIDSLRCVKNYLEINYKYTIKEFTELSESKTIPPVPLVINATKAFDFDGITKSYIEPNTPCSVDSLYFSESVNFIEFKSGIQKNIEFKNGLKETDEVKYITKYDIILENLRMKAVESIGTFNNRIIPSCTEKINISDFYTKYIVVIDSKEFASTALSVAFASASSRAKAPVNKQSQIEESLSRFKAKDKKGCKIYYDDVQVWNDKNFDEKLKNI